MKVKTTVTIRLEVTIDNTWEDSVSVRSLHADAGTASRNIVNRLLQGESRVRSLGPVNIASVLVADGDA